MNAGYSPTTVVSYPGIDGAAWAWDVFAGFDSGRHNVGPVCSPVLDVLARVGHPLGRYDTLRVELAPFQLEHGEHLTVVLPHRLDVIPRTILTTRNGILWKTQMMNFLMKILHHLKRKKPIHPNNPVEARAESASIRKCHALKLIDFTMPQSTQKSLINLMTVPAP